MKDGQVVRVVASWARDSLIEHGGWESIEMGNAYGKVMCWDESTKRLIPFVCGHGGSMWLCPSCAKELLERKDK